MGQGELGGGEGVEGRGQGIFHPPCHILHYHMVLRPGLRTISRRLWLKCMKIHHKASLEDVSSVI